MLLVETTKNIEGSKRTFESTQKNKKHTHFFCFFPTPGTRVFMIYPQRSCLFQLLKLNGRWRTTLRSFQWWFFIRGIIRSMLQLHEISDLKFSTKIRAHSDRGGPSWTTMFSQRFILPQGCRCCRFVLYTFSETSRRRWYLGYPKYWWNQGLAALIQCQGQIYNPEFHWISPFPLVQESGCVHVALEYMDCRGQSKGWKSDMERIFKGDGVGTSFAIFVFLGWVGLPSVIDVVVVVVVVVVVSFLQQLICSCVCYLFWSLNAEKALWPWFPSCCLEVQWGELSFTIFHWDLFICTLRELTYPTLGKKGKTLHVHRCFCRRCVRLQRVVYCMCILCIYIARWWFQRIVCFHPYLGGNGPFWLIFFKGGWNHQLDSVNFWTSGYFLFFRASFLA